MGTRGSCFLRLPRHFPAECGKNCPVDKPLGKGYTGIPNTTFQEAMPW